MATGPFGIGFTPPARMQPHTEPGEESFVFSNTLQVRDFSADSAALPATISARSTATFCGNVNSHCSARGALPDGDCSVSSKVPDAPRVTTEGGSNKVCALRETKARSRIAPRAK